MTVAYLWRKTTDYERFAYWSFFLAWIAAIVASVVGLIDRGQISYDHPSTAVLNQHITQAILFIVVSGLVIYSRFRWPTILSSEHKWWYLGLISFGVITLTATGWFGGELVYQWHIGLR